MMTDMNTTRLPLLAARVLNRPMMIDQSKMETIMGILGPRFGIDVDPLPEAAFVDTASSPEKRGYQQAPVIEGGVAVIDIDGTLVHETNGCAPWSGMTSYQWISGQIDQAVDDPAVKAIALRINSPGGECGSCFGLADRIAKVDQIKPVYAVVSNLACSAAYALAASARQIIAGVDSLVGSIGVIVTHYDFTAAAENDGLKVTYLQRGARKSDLAQFKSLDDESTASVMQQIDDLYAVFVGRVAANRGISEQAVMDTEANVFVGERAKSLGLVDAIMSEADALAWIGEQATSGGHVPPRLTQAKTERSTATMSKQFSSNSGGDQITAEDGADTIAGDDTMAAEDGADTITGDDTMTAEDDADTIAGDDTMAAEDDEDTVDGGEAIAAAVAAERTRCSDIMGLIESPDDFDIAADHITSGAGALEAAKAMSASRSARSSSPLAKRRAAMPSPLPGGAVPSDPGNTGPSSKEEAEKQFSASAEIRKRFGSAAAYWGFIRLKARSGN